MAMTTFEKEIDDLAAGIAADSARFWSLPQKRKMCFFNADNQARRGEKALIAEVAVAALPVASRAMSRCIDHTEMSHTYLSTDRQKCR